MIAPDPVAGDLIATLRAQRDTILSRWLAGVRSQVFHRPRPEEAITDHLPLLLDALLRALDGGPEVDAQGQEAALQHARARSGQGLDSGDVVTEFRLLRHELQRCLSGLPNTDPSLLGTSLRLNDGLDALIAVVLGAFDAIARARAGGLQAMGNVAREISALRPLEETLSLVCERARLLLQLDRATITLPNSRGELVLRTSTDSAVPGGAQARIAPGEGVTGTAFATGQPAASPGAGGATAPPIGATEGLGGMRSILAVPIDRGGRIIGTLSVATREVRPWGIDQVALLEALAAQTAVVLENARLYEALERRERLLDQVVQGAPALIAVLRGAEQRYELINPRYQELSPPISLLGRTPEAHDPPLGAELADALARALTGEAAFFPDLAVQARTPEGDPIVRHYSFSTIPLVEDSDEGPGVLVVGYETTDVVAQTARVESLARLAATRADTLAAIIGAIPDGVFVCTPDLVVTITNASGAALLGMSIEEAMAPLEVFARLDLRRADGQPLAVEDFPLARAVRGETLTGEEILARRGDDGEDRVLRLSVAPIRDEAGAIIGAVCIGTDLTIVRLREKQKDEFVSRASHELKTPLTGAKGLLQLARRRLARVEDAAGIGPWLETAEHQVDRLAVLVDDLRSVSQLRAGALRLRVAAVSVRDLVDEAARSLQTTTERHVLRVEPAADPLVVSGDPIRLAQVLDNLISNAIKYSPEGGEVRIRPYADGGMAVVEMHDQGIGVPVAERATLFEPFQRASNADDASTGMGLGLYISREIARQHGGDLLLASSGPGGSTFRLTVPLAGSGPLGVGEPEA